jgi:hypothetical protein
MCSTCRACSNQGGCGTFAEPFVTSGATDWLPFIKYYWPIWKPHRQFPFQKYSRTSMSGTASSGRKPISGRFSVCSDSFHKVQRTILKAGNLRVDFPSRLSKFNCTQKSARGSSEMGRTFLSSPHEAWAIRHISASLWWVTC